MQDFTTLHLFNTPSGDGAEVVAFVEARVLPRARALRGLASIDLFRCTPQQLMAETRQPWTFAVLYQSASAAPAIDLPALAPVVATLRDAGLVSDDDAERVFSYAMYHPWKYSAHHRAGPLSHLMFLLANFVPGHEAEYHRWYDDVHSVEIGETPGWIGMRRGRLCDIQVPPVRFCPGSELILGGLQTDDLNGALCEFFDRAVGRSSSGIAWGPRNSAASVARTVHILERVAGWETAGTAP